MLDIAIIGGGLSGLAVARSLHRQGRGVALFEARGRLGGRIVSVACARSGIAIDLGPTWFWPDTQPLIAQLIADLGLVDFPQHDEGTVLHLRDGDGRPELIEGKGIHNGARRLEGGMAGLIDALAKDLPRDHVHLDHALVGVRDQGNHILLTFRVGDHLAEVAARRVVLATQDAMRASGTWMAAQAKVVITYDRPSWRQAGQSGNAFVTHEQAAVGEIFDACDRMATKAALGGFLALSPEQRQTFAAGLPMLMGSQMVQVFGSALEHGEQYYRDWASEPYTCSSLDRSTPQGEHAGVSNPLLRRALWGEKLYLGGSETANHGAGYLEGALDAARRIDRALSRTPSSLIEREMTPRQDGACAGDPTSINAASLARFDAWVAAQIDTAFDGYHRRLNRSLAAQQITQRAILGSVEEVFGKALEVLEGLPFDMSAVTVERGRSALTPEVQKPFRNFMQSLLDDVIAFNRTSCALSNFPDEHHLAKEYVQTILRDIAAAWQEFSLSANRLLLAKAEAAPDRDKFDSRVTSLTS
jgi:monoamine oxidase